MPLLQVLRPTLPILIGASIMLTLSMGLRQSAGMGIGNGIATLDRGLYGTWAWTRPKMASNSASLTWKA